MQIKKILAGGLAAVAAGATIAFGAFAQSSNLGDYVQVSDSTLSSPMIVIGAAAGDVRDVIAAVDLGVAVAGYATQTVTVQGTGTSVSVSNGVNLATENKKIYLGDLLTKSGLKSTITSNDLPSILAQGTFYDDSGTAYTYNQYINVLGGTVTFGKSDGDLTDPEVYINTGYSTSSPLYNLTVTFNKPLNISSTDIQGNTIELFGNTYTIGSGSAYTSTTKKLVLFGGANAQTVSEGESATMTVEGTEHTVEVIGVSDSTTAVISVDGVSKEVTEGNSYTINGVDVYIDSVYYFGKESQTSSVKLSLGSSKIILEDGNNVKIGTDEDTIDGTLVGLTGTNNQGISKIEISVTAKDSSYDYIASGDAFEDPVFGSFKVAFGGLNTGDTDSITIDNSGTTGATLKFTDYRGNEKSITWAYTSSSSWNPDLNATSTRTYHVVEGETVKKNDYVLLAPSQESEFGHIMQYKAASSIGSSGAYIELYDVMSGDTQRIYLTDNSNTAAEFYIDGQKYYVNASNPSQQLMRFYWGSGASATTAGDDVMVFPLIKAKNGEWITLVKSVTLGSTSGINYTLPGDTSLHLVTNDTDTVTAGRLTYTFDDGTTTTTLETINGVNLTNAPAVLVYEEEGYDASETLVQDAVIVTIADGTGSGYEVAVQAPTLTAAVNSSDTMESDNSITLYGDRYGTMISYDSDNQGVVEISYPDEQATAMVAVGSDPTFTTGTSGGTYEAAVQITSPVAKLDTEVDTGSLNADLILVGGPCVNTLVATLLAQDNITCDTWNFTKGIIKEYTDAFGSGRKALIVAGTSADGKDTRDLAAMVMAGTMSYEA